jgi:hypothetical protein
MPQKRITRAPSDPPKSVARAESGRGGEWAPIERQRARQLDRANAEIIQIARGMLTRIVDLLK